MIEFKLWSAKENGKLAGDTSGAEATFESGSSGYLPFPEEVGQQPQHLEETVLKCKPQIVLTQASNCNHTLNTEGFPVWKTTAVSCSHFPAPLLCALDPNLELESLTP